VNEGLMPVVVAFFYVRGGESGEYQAEPSIYTRCLKVGKSAR